MRGATVGVRVVVVDVEGRGASVKGIARSVVVEVVVVDVDGGTRTGFESAPRPVTVNLKTH